MTSTFFFLESSHAAVRETLRRIVSGQSDFITANINEVDGCTFSIFPREDALVVGITYPVAWKTLKTLELEKVLATVFDAKDLIFKDETYDVIVKVAAFDPETHEVSQAVTPDKIESLATLRTFPALAAIAQASAVHVEQKGNAPMRRLAYRKEESMYYGSFRENFMVVLTLHIAHQDDRTLLQIFLQEMQEVKKHERTIVTSLGFTYTQKKLPVELASAEDGVVKENPGTEGLYFCSFTLYPRHMAPETLLKTVTHLINFRTNVMHHLAALKSYIHSKQRARIANLERLVEQSRTATTGKSTTLLK